MFSIFRRTGKGGAKNRGISVNSSSSNGDGTAVAQTENPPTDTTEYSRQIVNEPAILSYANAVLNTNYATLDGISDQELQRVYVIVQLDVLVRDCEAAAFWRKTPNDLLAEVAAGICKYCGGAMNQDSIECPSCGELDLPF